MDSDNIAECLHAELEEVERVLSRLYEGDYMERHNIYAGDGSRSKFDSCVHGKMIYEGCGACSDELLYPLLERVRLALEGFSNNV